MKYRMYIDEVGNADLEGSDDPNNRFLSLTGVICDLDHIDKKVFPELELLKKSFFNSHPDDPVILHRKEVLSGTGDFTALKNNDTRMEFNSRLLTLLTQWQYTVITVCIDKKAHRDTYTTWRFDPYHYCLAILIERFVLFLRRQQTHGDVMAESRGGKEDMRLKKSFHGIWESGSEYIPAEIFQTNLTSKELKVKPKSANISGLQLADLLAHPSRAEILYENGLLGKELPPFGKQIIEILQKKYDTNKGRIFGKKFIQ